MSDEGFAWLLIGIVIGAATMGRQASLHLRWQCHRNRTGFARAAARAESEGVVTASGIARVLRHWQAELGEPQPDEGES